MKNKATLGLFIVFLFLGITSCTSSQTILDTTKSTPEKIMNKLNNTSWVLKRLDIEKRDFVPTEGQEELVLSFNDNNYGTSDGCNGKGGEFTVEDNKIIFSIGMSTMRYCGEEMKDLIYSVPFVNAKSIKIIKNQLQLFDKNNNVIATYIKKDAE